MNDIEGTRTIDIRVGRNEIYLPKIGISGCFPIVIEFETDAKTYEFRMKKYGETTGWSDGPYRFSSASDKELGQYNSLFTHMRDGMPSLSIESDVAGTLTLHYTRWYKKPTAEELERRKLENEKRMNHYGQFFTREDGILYLDERLHNYTPYDGLDKDIEELVKEAQDYLVPKEDIQKVIKMPRCRDIITHLEIDNLWDQQTMTIQFTGSNTPEKLVTLVLNPGKHKYEVIIPIASMNYQNCEMVLGDPKLIVSLRVCGVNIPSEFGARRPQKKIMVSQSFGKQESVGGFLRILSLKKKAI